MAMWDKLKGLFGGAPQHSERLESTLVGESKAGSVTEAHNQAIGFSGWGGVGAGGVSRNATTVLRMVRQAPWLGASVDALSEDVAGVPWHLYLQRNAMGNHVQPRWAAYEQRQYRERAFTLAKQQGLLEEVTSHPLLTLLDRPNPYMSGHAFRYLVAGWCVTVGGAYVAINRSTQGYPAELWPVPPTWVSQSPTPDGILQDFVMTVHGMVWRLPKEDVLWIRRPALDEPYIGSWGIGTLLADEVHADEAASRRVGAFFDNGMLPEAIVSAKAGAGGASKEALKEVKAQFETNLRGVWNAFKLYFTSGNVEVARLDTTFREMELVNLRKFLRDTTRQVAAIPPEILGITESSNRATAVAAEYLYARTLRRHLERMRMGLLLPLARQYSPYLVPEYADPTPPNNEFALGVMRARPSAFADNEVRALAGYEPREGRDELPAPTTTPTPTTPAPPGQLNQEPPWALHMRGEMLPHTKAEGGNRWVENVLEALRAETLTAEVSPVWVAQVANWGRRVLNELGAAPSFALLNPLIPEHVGEVAGERMRQITETTREALRSTLREGVQAGESIPQLARRVRQTMDEASRARATTIARTEVVRSSNWATWQAHSISGVVDRRKWVDTQDSRTREAHRALRNQERGIAEAFEVPSGKYSGAKAMHPGGFTQAALSVNCRCTTVAVIVDPQLNSAVVGYAGAIVRVAKEGEELPWEGLWKAYEQELATWEAAAEEAVRRGLAAQEGQVLRRMEQLGEPG